MMQLFTESVAELRPKYRVKPKMNLAEAFAVWKLWSVFAEQKAQ